MPKRPTGGSLAEARAAEVAAQMGYTLIDVELVKESTGRFLRFYIDKDGGVSIDDCEAFHRAVMKLCEDIDYDYMEVSSPGVDRPLKKDADFARALGGKVEVRLYRPLDKARVFTGVLSDFGGDFIEIEDAQGERRRFERRAVALIKPVFEFDEALLADTDGEDEA